MSKSICVSGCTTRALSENNDAIGISAEISNVVVDPVHSSVNIQKPKVLRSSGICKLRCIWLAKDVQPIIECNNSNIVVVANDELAIVRRYITLPKKSMTIIIKLVSHTHSTKLKPTAVNPNHDSRILLSENTRRPDIDRETIFRFRYISNNTPGKLQKLDICGTVHLNA